jgi:hypothetical protein
MSRLSRAGIYAATGKSAGQVVYGGSAAAQYKNTSGPTITTNNAALTPTGTNVLLLALVVTTNLNAGVIANRTVACNSSVDGAFTEVPGSRIDINNGNTGGCVLFYKIAPTLNVSHNITGVFTYGSGIYGDGVLVIPAFYTGVNQSSPLGVAAVEYGAAGAALSLSGLASGSFGFFGYGGNASPAGAATPVERQAGGRSVNGPGKYGLIADGVPSAGISAFSTTNTASHATIGVEIKAA